jgi:hypothetical protein
VTQGVNTVKNLKVERSLLKYNNRDNMAKHIKGPAWDIGQLLEETPQVVEKLPQQAKPKRNKRRPNKKIGRRAYYLAYKAVMRGIPAEIKRKVLDPHDNGPESRAFVQAVIVLAENKV